MNVGILSGMNWKKMKIDTLVKWCLVKWEGKEGDIKNFETENFRTKRSQKYLTVFQKFDKFVSRIVIVDDDKIKALLYFQNAMFLRQ